MRDSAGATYDAMNTLLAQMHDLVRAMSEDQPRGIKVDRVTQFAATAVPGAEHSAVSMINGNRQPRTIAATSDLPLQVDKIQYELGEGPCVQALIQSDMVWSGDLANDQQWPRFGRRAVEETGVHSMASYRLFLSQDNRGALNFYSAKTQAFDQLALGVGALFAAYASLTLLNELHEDKIMNLERALESSREIGTAMGILMARELCTQEQAFDRLRTASQHTHRKLREIAAEVKDTGALPPPPPHR